MNESESGSPVCALCNTFLYVMVLTKSNFSIVNNMNKIYLILLMNCVLFLYLNYHTFAPMSS